MVTVVIADSIVRKLSMFPILGIRQDQDKNNRVIFERGESCASHHS